MAKIPKVILLIESSRASGRSLLRGVAQYARHRGPWAFYWEPRGLEKVWPRLKRLQADGIILRDVEKVDEVIRCGLPAIVVGHQKQAVPGVANVMTDSERVAAMTADHLIDCGFHHFAYCGFDGIPWSDVRSRHFADRIAAAGFRTHFYRRPRRAAVRAGRNEDVLIAGWLRSLPKPIGLMSCNDDRGQQVLEA